MVCIGGVRAQAGIDGTRTRGGGTNKRACRQMINNPCAMIRCLLTHVFRSGAYSHIRDTYDQVLPDTCVYAVCTHTYVCVDNRYVCVDNTYVCVDNRYVCADNRYVCAVCTHTCTAVCDVDVPVYRCACVSAHMYASCVPVHQHTCMHEHTSLHTHMYA